MPVESLEPLQACGCFLGLSFFASHKQRQDQLETGPGLAEADEAEAERS